MVFGRLQTSVLFLIIGLFGKCVVATAHTELKQWTTSSFSDFAEGTLADGGVNTYVDVDGNIRLINLWDFNNDGNLDLPVTCPQDYKETVDLFIYWADSDGFDPNRVTTLPALGAVSGAAADLNKDGHVDLIVLNRFDGEKTNLDAFIYWGSANGFSAGNRSGLPAHAAEAVAVADLDKDDYLDIVIANNGADYHMGVDRFQKSFIYWGSSSGFSVGNRSTVKTIQPTDVKISDLNADGNLDIIFVNEGNAEDTSLSGAAVHFGNGKGTFPNEPSLLLPGLFSSAVAIEDLNNDGLKEIVLANRFILAEKEAKPASSYNVETDFVNSYIYWGHKDGYSTDNITHLPTVGVQTTAIADFNGDHLPDIIFGNNSHGLSFIYWNSAKGFDATRRFQLVTPSVRSRGNTAMRGLKSECLIEDLNADGKEDMIFVNHGDKETFDINSYIYWGDVNGIDLEKPTELPTKGASGAIAADLNDDGRKDVVFFNKITGLGDEAETTSYLYWGNANGHFSQDNRATFPTSGWSDDYANADMNRDGIADLIVPRPRSLLFYYGSNEGLSANTREVKITGKGAALRFADFNRDGYLDILFAKGSILFGQKGGFLADNSYTLEFGDHPGIYSISHSIADLNKDGWIDILTFDRAELSINVFWNSALGFDSDNKTVLPNTSRKVQLDAADYNRDGWLDLIIVNMADVYKSLGPKESRLYGWNPNSDSLIYWGGPDGLSANRKLALPTIGGQSSVSADFNADGYLDVAFTQYHGGDHRQYPVRIYYNSSTGFDVDNPAELPADSGCGILAFDSNLDGYQELAVANHVLKDGDHHNAYISIFEGDKDGFKAHKKQQLPAHGPHFFSYADIGDSYNRTDRYDYISAPFKGGPNAQYESISWQAQTPFRTRIEFQIRTASTLEDLVTALWQGPDGPDSYYSKSGATLPTIKTNQPYIQYKASLISPNSANSPILESVSIAYQ